MTFPAPHFSVLTPLEFIEDVREEAKKAKHRVFGQAMEVEPGELTNPFLDAFTEAAKRGIDTRLHIDYFTLLVTEGLFNYIPRITRAKHRRKMSRLKTIHTTFQTMRENGVRILYTNKPELLDRLFPMRGRNHMKIVIVDDKAWIGGVNFHDDNFKGVDVMIKIHDKDIVEEIAHVYERVDKEEVIHDLAIHCNDESTLLVDGGKINHSLILNHTVSLINKAEHSVKLISPLIPDAALLVSLAKAQKRGVTIEMLSQKISRMTGLFKLVDEFNDALVKLRGIHLPIIYKNSFLHAKIVIVDEKEAIIGSHNFSSRGVRMGTEEIALESRNETLVKNLLTFYGQVKDKK